MQTQMVAGILSGATASGKTALAVLLARQLPIEVISADSRQVYRRLDIGTAKPTAAERAAVPHHLIDCIELDESYNAARFADETERHAAEIRARGRIPLVVGGAGFYLKVLREGLFDAPFDAAELERVRREVETWDTETMRRRLLERDPERFAAIHPNDRYRLSRALEICIAAGRNVTQLTRERPPVTRRFLEFHLDVPRSELHARIAARTDAMLQHGWLDEVERLRPLFASQPPGLGTLGYPHVIAHLEGSLDYDTMRNRILRDTRRFARQQDIWFRKLQHAVHLKGTAPANAALMARALADAFEPDSAGP